MGGGVQRHSGATLDLGAWRTCDGGALLLLETRTPSADELVDLYLRGDLEERTMVLRALACLPLGSATATLLGEVQRSNTVPHFAAAVCDSDLLIRARDAGVLDADDANRMLLKLAFVDLPLARVFDATRLANTELSRMLQDLASEREAAGRRVWRDTNLLIAHAPTAGTLARIAGGLEHGDDAHRIAAARGAAHIADPVLLRLARERLDREPSAAVRTELAAALRAAERTP